jgi:uncharacterized small protein (DUF1192 family)
VPEKISSPDKSISMNVSQINQHMQLLKADIERKKGKTTNKEE